MREVVLGEDRPVDLFFPFGLEAHDFENAVSRDDAKRGERHDRAGKIAPGLGVRPGLPDEDALSVERGECAGVGVRDGADEVVQLDGAPVPVDAAVLRASSSERRRLTLILRRQGRGSRFEQVEVSCDDPPGRLGDLVGDVLRRVPERDFDRLLIHDVPRVRALDHCVKCRARFLFAPQDGPVDAGPAPVLREQGAVHVERAELRDLQNVLREHGTVVERQDEVGSEVADDATYGVVHGRRREHVQIRFQRKALHRREPDLLCGVVPVGEDADDVRPPVQKFRQAGVAHLVVGEDENTRP